MFSILKTFYIFPRSSFFNRVSSLIFYWQKCSKAQFDDVYLSTPFECERIFFYYGCLGDFFFSTSALNKLKHVDGNFQDFNAFVDAAGASSQALLLTIPFSPNFHSTNAFCWWHKIKPDFYVSIIKRGRLIIRHQKPIYLISALR